MRNWINRTLLLVMLACVPASAVTTVELYVDTDVSGGAGDGSSWSNAYNTLQGGINGFGTVDLVNDDKMLILHIRGSTNATTTANSAPNITNGNATHYLSLLVDAEDRHQGVWSNSKYRIACGTGVTYTAGLLSLPAYTVIDGFQIKMAGDGSHGISVNNNYTTIRNCIIAGGSRGITIPASRTGIVVQNCIMTGVGVGAFLDSAATFNSCTAVNCGTYGFQMHGTYMTMTLRNCYAGGTGTADYYKDATSTFALTTCFSEDGTGATSTVEFSTNTFTNVTAGSENLHLVAGSGLIGVGTDIGAYMDPDDDIDGDSRPQGGTWDVGADEYAEAAAAGKPYYYRANQ